MNRPDSDQYLVLDAVRLADRRARAQRAVRMLARTAPLAGALLLLTAVAAYFARWPVGVTIAVGLASATVLAALVVMTARHRPVADVTAARIDADADLKGELRSAHWFAGVDSQDPWVLFHLERAAERVRAVLWSDVYPPVRARRAWAATLVMTAVACALPLGLVIRHAVASASSPDSVTVALDGPISPALRDEVLAVLEAALRNGVPLDDVMAAVSQVVGVKSSDPRLREQISELLKQHKFSAAIGQAVETTTEANGAKDAQSERASQDAKPLPDELRRALQQLAAGVAREAERTNSRAEDESPEAAEQAPGDTAAASGSPQGAPSPSGELPDDMGSGQTATESAAARSERGGAAAGEMMMMDSEDGFAGGTPGLGYGGVKGPSLLGDPKQIAAALKLELLEANTNIDGADIRTEDARKTEQGRSAIAYSKTAGLATFARALGDVPPSVPEVRRPLVARYFVRTAAPANSGVAQPASPR